MDDGVRWIGGLIDAYAAAAPKMERWGVASSDVRDHGVPPDMWVGPVDADGWVEWAVLPSTLTTRDVEAIETEFGIQFPPAFRAYLLARHHCFDQLRSARYDQLILFPAVPTRDPFDWLKSELTVWHQLLGIGLIPFAEWGDGWGPMCFDVAKRQADGDCLVCWLDHEWLIPLGRDGGLDRAGAQSLVQPLYRSCREMLRDLFRVT